MKLFQRFTLLALITGILGSTLVMGCGSDTTTEETTTTNGAGGNTTTTTTTTED